MQGEFVVSRCQGADEMILEHLDCAFGRVYVMVAGLNQHEDAIFFGEEFFDLSGALVVRHI